MGIQVIQHGQSSSHRNRITGKCPCLINRASWGNELHDLFFASVSSNRHPTTDDFANLLKDAGLHVPLILEENQEKGFLLLSDLGSKTYLSVLSPSNAKALYRDASQALVKMQLASREGVLPPYDDATLQLRTNN